MKIKTQIKRFFASENGKKVGKGGCLLPCYNVTANYPNNNTMLDSDDNNNNMNNKSANIIMNNKGNTNSNTTSSYNRLTRSTKSKLIVSPSTGNENRTTTGFVYSTEELEKKQQEFQSRQECSIEHFFYAIYEQKYLKKFQVLLLLNKIIIL